jgi:hypothetical protein
VRLSSRILGRKAWRWEFATMRFAAFAVELGMATGLAAGGEERLPTPERGKARVLRNRFNGRSLIMVVGDAAEPAELDVGQSRAAEISEDSRRRI